MKSTSGTITLGSKTFIAICADYDSYTTDAGSIDLGAKTFSAIQAKGVEENE